MCQPLVDLKVLAASDSVEGFVLSYTSLLEQAPGITPALLERLITARADIARADVKEVRHRMRHLCKLACLTVRILQLSWECKYSPLWTVLRPLHKQMKPQPCHSIRQTDVMRSKMSVVAN